MRPWRVAGLVGLVASTGAAWLLGMDTGLMHSGLYGYNGPLRPKPYTLNPKS